MHIMCRRPYAARCTCQLRAANDFKAGIQCLPLDPPTPVCGAPRAPAQINEVLHDDQLDVHDHGGATCETVGALAGFPTFEQTAALDDTTPSGTAVGWINDMSAATCPQ